MNWAIQDDMHVLYYDTYVAGIVEHNPGVSWRIVEISEQKVVHGGISFSLEEAKKEVEEWITLEEGDIWEKKLLWEIYEEKGCIKGEAYLRDTRIRLVWSEECSVVSIQGMFLSFKKVSLEMLQSIAFAFAIAKAELPEVLIETQKSAFVFSCNRENICTVVTVGEKEIVIEKSDGAKVSREVEDIGSVGRLDLREVVERVIPIFKESE